MQAYNQIHSVLNTVTNVLWAWKRVASVNVARRRLSGHRSNVPRVHSIAHVDARPAHGVMDRVFEIIG